MSRKPRPESLWAKLKSDANRDLVFEWLIVEGISYEECAARCVEHFALQPSEGALKTFYRKHAFPWKIAKAKQTAEEEKGALPKDWQDRIREALAQRRFEATFQELSRQEIIALERLELDKDTARTTAAFEREKIDLKKLQVAQKDAEIKLAREKFELEAAEKMLDAALRKKADEINASSMTNAAKIAAMRQAAFAEIDELQRSGKVVIPK